VAFIETLLLHLPEGTEENHEKSSVTIACFADEIRTQHPPSSNMSLGPLLIRKPVGKCVSSLSSLRKQSFRKLVLPPSSGESTKLILLDPGPRGPGAGPISPSSYSYTALIRVRLTLIWFHVVLIPNVFAICTNTISKLCRSILRTEWEARSGVVSSAIL
jgi:hypothetical protein